ncbi:MAG: S-methyl-5'-thioadenosine phosphorylase [Deltaproteobacteria bacterium]|nr:S-methyl-5'-thioadenosine phosphorylase [Deltaproteobacteria bacterium]
MGHVLGVLGGSGLYHLPGLAEVTELSVDTPFGAPSDALVRGRLGDTELVFLPRHGRQHAIPPSRVNYRANIHALKQLGCTHVVSVSAVGSLREELLPGHLVVPSQYIDRTVGRAASFFDEGVAVHVSMADPVCPVLAEALAGAAATTGATVHTGRTYVCIEGPRFSTRAESHLFRQWGADVVGMTNVPEAFLAREAELPYATLCLSTDYDCWRPHDEVDVTAILAILKQNVERAQETLRALSGALPDPARSPARSALQYALLTRPEAVPAGLRQRYRVLLGRFFEGPPGAP